MPGAGLAPTAPLNMHNFTESQPQTRPVWDPAGSRQNKTTPQSYMNTGKREHCSNHKMTKHPPMLALVSECYFSPSYNFGPPLGFLLWAPSSGVRMRTVPSDRITRLPDSIQRPAKPRFLVPSPKFPNTSPNPLIILS